MIRRTLTAALLFVSLLLVLAILTRGFVSWYRERGELA
jgi:hypothetical protein